MSGLKQASSAARCFLYLPMELLLQLYNRDKADHVLDFLVVSDLPGQEDLMAPGAKLLRVVEVQVAVSLLPAWQNC